MGSNPDFLQFAGTGLKSDLSPSIIACTGMAYPGDPNRYTMAQRMRIAGPLHLIADAGAF